MAGLDADTVLVLTRYIEEHRRRHPLTVVAALRAWSPFMEGADRLVVLQDGRVAAWQSRPVARTAPPIAETICRVIGSRARRSLPE